jgi:hypothetical protein
MSFKNRLASMLMIALGLWGAGCGNYSNEDLEFMNALPDSADLSAEVPAVRSSISLGDTPELYRMTRNVVVVFNGVVDAFLSLIDTIRSFSPTTRRPSERIWGPFPAENQAGWMVRMVMKRVDLANFSYQVGFRPAAFVGGDDDGWLNIINGTFAAAGGVRKGSGTLAVMTADARAAGLDPGLGYLDWMTASYDNHAFPINVNLQFANLPNPLKPDDPTDGDYTYKALQNGQGELTFNWSAYSIPGPLLDVFNVTSRWLGTGEGQSDLQVVSGDAAGARETQCWNQLLQAVYIDKPWLSVEDIGTPSDCPSIPTL